MRFAVRRAGERWDTGMPPCDAAQPARVARYDRRTFQSPDEHDARFPGRPWLSEGTEHDYWSDGRQGGIRRRLSDEAGWVVDLDAGGLAALAVLFGEVAIAPPDGPAQPPKLTLGSEL